MPIGIYPPTLKSTLPAFVLLGSGYPIYFTLLKVTSFDSIGHVQIRIVKLTNNRSIANTALYPDGTIYKPVSLIQIEDNYYYVTIYNSELSENMQPGSLYKIQMRFGSNALYTSVSSFASWKQTLIDEQAFSEWSTVMVIKPIQQPQIIIENAQVLRGDIVSIYQRPTETTLTPMFYGTFYLSDINKEALSEYKFNLYKGEKTASDIELSESEGLIETSGWIRHNAVVNSTDKHRFATILDNNELYTVFYFVRSVNGFEGKAAPYTFLATRTYLDELEGVTLSVNSTDEYCRENACINIYLSADTLLSGAYVLTRASEKTNFGVWEDLQFFIFSARSFNETLIYRDFTIESGVKYRYAFAQENREGLRTNPIKPEPDSAHSVDFLYSYLYHDGKLLKLKFNQTINSFKHTVLTTKQDTLGGKYPRLSKNGYAYYAEFPISGLISFHMDTDYTFLTVTPEGFKFNDDLVIPREKFAEIDDIRRPCAEHVDTSGESGLVTNYNSPTIDFNMTDDNIYVERMFRNKVEEFLNDFDYKLYKSPTEGNIIVALLNIQLTPELSLGRMIYSFTATAYEVMENTLENMNEYKLINIGHYDTISLDEIIHLFGQVSGIYTPENSSSSIDVYSMIKAQEEIPVTGGYKLQLRRLSSFWIERYPKEEVILLKTGTKEVELEDGRVTTGTDGKVLRRKIRDADLTLLNAMLSKAKTEGSSESEIRELEAEITEIEELLAITLTGWLEAPVRLRVNGQEVVVAPYRLYTLNYPVQSLEVIYANYPIIINYTSDLVLVEDLSKGVTYAIVASRIWGLIAGVFTDTDEVIKYGYFWDYGPNVQPFKVDDEGRTNFWVYKTRDLYAIIEEETRQEVERINNVKFTWDYNAKEWVSSTLYYGFSGITSFEIEAEPNTLLKIGSKTDGSDAITVRIGKTGRYVLSPTNDNMIRYILLVNPANALVNYKCLTSLRYIKRYEE